MVPNGEEKQPAETWQPGINANQLAMAAMCKLDQHEKQVIAEAILQQKVGANAKAAKQYHEHVEREKH